MTIQEHFEQNLAGNLPSLAAGQVNAIRAVFFAGATVVLNEIRSYTALPEHVAVERVRLLIDECETFARAELDRADQEARS